MFVCIWINGWKDKYQTVLPRGSDTCIYVQMHVYMAFVIKKKATTIITKETDKQTKTLPQRC